MIDIHVWMNRWIQTSRWPQNGVVVKLPDPDAPAEEAPKAPHSLGAFRVFGLWLLGSVEVLSGTVLQAVADACVYVFTRFWV